MPMPPYPLRCYQPGCPHPAVYKVAARWSDGVIAELKTYGLTCGACLPAWFRRSRQRHATCRRAAHETLEAPGIYRLERGRRDVEIPRLVEIERELLQSS